MPVVREEVLAIGSSADVVSVRQRVRHLSQALHFSLVDQTKIVTAASELARNTIEHGKGGTCRLEVVEEPPRTGLRLTFEDRGPGISNVELALQDGYTTGNGLGLGLGGAKRLVNEFTIESSPGKGTRITVVRWH
jgi:serine/threonine-protein kinase RsbT